MRKPAKHSDSILDALGQQLSALYPRIKLVWGDSACMDDGQGNDYRQINVLNVPASLMTQVEDLAYEGLRRISDGQSAPICFSLYSPEETTVKFPAVVDTLCAVLGEIMSLNDVAQMLIGDSPLFDGDWLTGGCTETHTSLQTEQCSEPVHALAA